MVINNKNNIPEVSQCSTDVTEEFINLLTPQLRKAHYGQCHEAYVQNDRVWGARAYVLRHLIKEMGKHLGTEQGGTKELYINEIGPGTNDVMAQVIPKLIKQKYNPFTINYSAVDRGQLDKGRHRIRNKIVTTLPLSDISSNVDKEEFNPNNEHSVQESMHIGDARIFKGTFISDSDGLYRPISQIEESLQGNPAHKPDVLVSEHTLYPFTHNKGLIKYQVDKLSHLIKPQDGLGIFTISYNSDINKLRQRYTNTMSVEERQKESQNLLESLQEKFGSDRVRTVAIESQITFPVLSEEQWNHIEAGHLNHALLKTESSISAIRLLEFFGDAPEVMGLKDSLNLPGGWNQYIKLARQVLKESNNIITTNDLMVIFTGKESSAEFVNDLDKTAKYLQTIVSHSIKQKEGFDKPISWQDKIDKYSERPSLSRGGA